MYKRQLSEMMVSETVALEVIILEITMFILMLQEIMVVSEMIEKITHQEILEIKETNQERITMAVLEEIKEIKIHLQEISIIKGTTILEILKTKEVNQKTTTMAVSEEKLLKGTKEMK